MFLISLFSNSIIDSTWNSDGTTIPHQSKISMVYSKCKYSQPRQEISHIHITISTKNKRVYRQLNKPIQLYTPINRQFRLVITKNHSINSQTQRIISSHHSLHQKYTKFYFPLSFHSLSALLLAHIHIFGHPGSLLSGE